MTIGSSHFCGTLSKLCLKTICLSGEKKEKNCVDRTYWNLLFFPKAEKDWLKLFQYDCIFSLLWNFKQCKLCLKKQYVSSSSGEKKEKTVLNEHIGTYCFFQSDDVASIRRCCLLFLCFFVLKSTIFFTSAKTAQKSFLLQTFGVR